MVRLSSSRKSGRKKGSSTKKKKKMESLEIEETERFVKSRRRRKWDEGAEYGETDEFEDEEAGASSKCCGMSNVQRRATLLMLTLAALVGAYVYQMDETIFEDTQNDLAQIDKKAIKTVHTTSFGGINNIAHPGGAKAAARGEGLAFENIFIPKSNVGHAIPSLGRPNMVNSWGHYVHDEHRSPYASILYNATKDELKERQQNFLEKMAKVREEWGAWDFRDPREDADSQNTTSFKDIKNEDRTMADFTGVDYKDLPVEDFPPDSWQADEEYVGRFLEEAKKLVGRMKEGIYAESGYPSDNPEREELFKVHRWTPEACTTPEGMAKGDIQALKRDCGMSPAQGIASLQNVAFEGLVKKLLHSMMTNDEFYVVTAGHSAAAGHGNDFQQNRIITFQYIMEPVFDKLGMRLVSRNMAMGGVGTLHFSLAGGDLYGETDIIEWDSGMTEGRNGAAVDFFNKQAILSGERVPLIMSSNHYSIMEETNETALIGRWTGKNENIFPTTTQENCQDQVWAARWWNGKEHKYNAICWEPRSDFTPAKKQQAHPGSQVGWHPGNRQHQWSGRLVALLVLEALEVAFARWEKGIASGGAPLDASLWHIGEDYKTIRQNLRTHVPNQNTQASLSRCEQHFAAYPRICRLQMHGYGMWKPRAHVEYDFLNLIHEAPNGYKPSFKGKNVYDGFDLLPLIQAVPDGEIDVHAIAIATTSPAPDIDQSWIEDEEEAGNVTSADGAGNATDLPPPTRRWLRQAADIGFRKGAEEFPPSMIVKNRKLVSTTKESSRALPSSSDNDPMLRRKLEKTTEIVPGRGWEMHGWHPTKGFCDGSAQSECVRYEENDCMITGANDNHLDVQGSSMSGWLVFTVPKVREGIILLRMEWWCGQASGKGHMAGSWTEVNNGMTDDTTPWNATSDRELMDTNSKNYHHRNLRKPTKAELIPDDLEMDIAINGVIKTMGYDEWLKYSNPVGSNVGIWPIFDDRSMAERDWEGEPVEVAIRFRTKKMPVVPYCVSHVYFA